MGGDRGGGGGGGGGEQGPGMLPIPAYDPYGMPGFMGCASLPLLLSVRRVRSCARATVVVCGQSLTCGRVCACACGRRDMAAYMGMGPFGASFPGDAMMGGYPGSAPYWVHAQPPLTTHDTHTHTHTARMAHSCKLHMFLKSRQNERVCYKCGGGGHIARSCPLPNIDPVRPPAPHHPDLSAHICKPPSCASCGVCRVVCVGVWLTSSVGVCR
jgi:hypothetical protein